MAILHVVFSLKMDEEFGEAGDVGLMMTVILFRDS